MTHDPRQNTRPLCPSFCPNRRPSKFVSPVGPVPGTPTENGPCVSPLIRVRTSHVPRFRPSHFSRKAHLSLPLLSRSTSRGSISRLQTTPTPTLLLLRPSGVLRETRRCSRLESTLPLYVLLVKSPRPRRAVPTQLTLYG